MGWPAISKRSPSRSAMMFRRGPGPTLGTRRMLFDFIVEELAQREPEDARRIRPVRVALQNQRDTLLAFAGVPDAKLAGIAQAHAIAEPLVHEAYLLHRLPSTSPAYWQG